MRESFIFYKSFYEAIHELDFEEQADILEAICEYQFNGSEPHFDSKILKPIWLLIKPQLEANNERYENGIKRRQTKKRKTSGYEIKNHWL